MIPLLHGRETAISTPSLSALATVRDAVEPLVSMPASLIRDPFETDLEYQIRIAQLSPQRAGQGALIRLPDHVPSDQWEVHIDWQGWVPPLLGMARRFEVRGLAPTLLHKDIQTFTYPVRVRLEYTPQGLRVQQALLKVGEQMIPIQPREPEPGEQWTEPCSRIPFVWIPGGKFRMGNVFESGFSDEIPVHKIRLSGFWMGRHPVTQGQWRALMGNNPAFFDRNDDHPVEMVSWRESMRFIARLKQVSGRLFDLPTEAQWEYACRDGGHPKLYAGGHPVEMTAWYRRNSGGSTHAVGLKQATQLGLFDMCGNVWEWTRDWYSADGYKNHKKHPPRDTRQGMLRVCRGGGWGSDATSVRSVFRDGVDPHYRANNIGFRLVCIC
jgi:formylglycine-generating enzyme required for sulfatase activity